MGGRRREEDGAQAFQVSIEVSSSDGAPRAEARIERKQVSRAVLNESGRAFGFVFGPSISIGDVGTSF